MRRFKELKVKNKKISFKEVLKSIKKEIKVIKIGKYHP